MGDMAWDTTMATVLTDMDILMVDTDTTTARGVLMPRLHLRPMLRLATMLDTATTTARGALMLRLIPPTSSTLMLDMLLMLMLLSSAPLLPTPTSTFLPLLPPTASPSSTSVRLMPMLRQDTTVDTTATTPTDTDTVPMATTLMPTTTESRSAIIKLYTKVFFK